MDIECICKSKCCATRRSMDVLWVVLVFETCSNTRAEWANYFLFYVLRSLLRVGTLRAQYSECVPSHSFTPNFLRIQKHKWPYKITRACVCAWGLSAKIRTPPLWFCSPVRLFHAIGVIACAHYRSSIQELLHPEIRSSHFCAYSVCSFHNLPIGSAL